jgi:hypothetical protein
VPVICIKNESGEGAIPAFTSMEHLLNWKRDGCLYITITGRVLLEMAINMSDVAEIQINPYDAPRGRIPRVDFANILTL